MNITKTYVFPGTEMVHWVDNNKENVVVIHKVQFTDHGNYIIDGKPETFVPWSLLIKLINEKGELE